MSRHAAHDRERVAPLTVATVPVTGRRPTAGTTGVLALATAVVLFSVLWSTQTNTVPPYVASQLPDTTAGLSVACVPPGTAYTAAARYTGAAPHPVAIFDDGRQDPHQPVDSATEPWNPTDPASVQLVACVEKTANDQRPFVMCGEYSTTNALQPTNVSRVEVNVIGAWYRISVYELRTHRELTSTRALGQDTTCPPSVTTASSSSVFLDSSLSSDQLQQVLDPYVHATVTQSGS